MRERDREFMYLRERDRGLIFVRERRIDSLCMCEREG